jgi:flagellar basal-body rod protein FlgF
MNIGIYQSAASLSALERWQDTVTQNISSSQTPGYRKRTTEFSTVNAGQMQTNTGAGGSDDTVQSSQFPQASGAINFLPGEAQATGRDLDVSIQGNGFFQVQGPDGQMEYTRAGEFEIRPDNTLVTSSGQTVMGDSGKPITLLPGGGTMIVNRDGTISQNNTVIGKLSIQQFADNSQLEPSAGGAFVPTGGATPTPVAKPDLIQGYLEGSNVSPMHEMVDLITISRAYESNQKMITTMDTERQKTLDALG